MTRFIKSEFFDAKRTLPERVQDRKIIEYLNFVYFTYYICEI